MKKNQVITMLIVAAFVALLVGINSIEPSRVSERQQEESLEAQRLIAEAEQAESAAEEEGSFRTRVLATMKDVATEGGERVLAESTPSDGYQVEFQCSNGTFVVEVYNDWSPLGAAHFKEIVESGVYDEARFFRVVPKFVVQWGIPADPEASKKWGAMNIQDEPVKSSNVRGTITYAMSQAKNSRTTQVFINFADNTRLDGMGFAPIGKVIKGMEVVDAINAEYSQQPEQDMIESRGNAYLKEYFPRLDYIKKAQVLGDIAPPSGDDAAKAESGQTALAQTAADASGSAAEPN